MPEQQNVEWKSSWRDEYLKWICGFANAQGGVLEIGKNDRGEVVGVKDILRLLEAIPNKTQSLLGIVVDVNLKAPDGREYLEIAVDPHPNAISYRGEFHYRSGSTKQVLRGAARSRFLLQKYGRTWDDVPLPGVDLKDLDGRTLDGFRKKGANSERLPEDIRDESDGGIIERLQLREADHLKRAAVLLFHPAPERFSIGAQVKIGAFRGSEILYQDIVEGDLFTQVERTLDLLYTKYPKALISYDGIYRVETFPVPRKAMREAVINAVIHRDYQNPATIQIRVEADRIGIWNPAALPSGWTAVPADGAHASKPLNPRIAYAFFRAGMIEAWGRGLRRIQDACQAADVPAPEWKSQPDGGLWLRFPFSEAYMEADARSNGDVPGQTGLPGGQAVSPAIGEGRTTRKTARKQPENSQPGQPEGAATTQETTRTTQETTQKILVILRQNPAAGRREIAAILRGITEDGVKYHLDRLKTEGLLRVGPTRGGRWEVLEPPNG